MAGLEHIYRVYILTQHGQPPLIINSCVSISVRSDRFIRTWTCRKCLIVYAVSV